MKYYFASDNCAGAHPDIIKSFSSVNDGFVPSYGADEHTEKASQIIKNAFGVQSEIFFCLTGTAANIISLASVLNPYQGVICADTAHINVDECGAPERFTGSKLISVPNSNGKITPEDIEGELHSLGFEHHAQPYIVSISQATELGTVYSIEEIKAICGTAHKHGLYVHMDGSRMFNAVCSLGCSLADVTVNAGVDILSLGGTKNGMAIGEAVIFFNKDLCKNTKYVRKQAMQLFSKMRFISCQFQAFFENDLWRFNAEKANSLALYFAEKLEQTGLVKLSKKVETNAVFAVFPEDIRVKMQEKYFFYLWNNKTGECRLMTSFATKKEYIDEFIEELLKI